MRCINAFVEKSPPDAKTQVPIFMAPGLTIFSRLGTGPINGLHVMAGILYAISGSQLFSINPNGLATLIGSTNLGGALISMADNETQLIMVDGNVGWVYQPAGLNQVLLDTANGFTMTSLAATANIGATSISVEKITNFHASDSIGILLDGGGLFKTTVSGTPGGSTINLAAPMPSQASAGAGVYDYTTGDNIITLATIGTITTGQTITVDLDNGTTFVTTISALSGPPSALIVTLAGSLPSTASAGAVAVVTGVTLGQITAPAFQAANTVVYFDDYFIFNAAGTNNFFLSNLGDGTQYSGLDFASAQANPDYILGIANYHEQLLLFGGSSIEVWYDSGAANFPFQRYDGAYIQRGAAGPGGIVQEDNTVFWLGEDGIFYRLNGYSPVRISTFGTEAVWVEYPTFTDVQTFVVTMEGHKFIFMTFPSGNQTWCYDIATGSENPLWHERESWGSPWL
jgi:hypothetical protein